MSKYIKVENYWNHYFGQVLISTTVRPDDLAVKDQDCEDRERGLESRKGQNFNDQYVCVYLYVFHMCVFI